MPVHIELDLKKKGIEESDYLGIRDLVIEELKARGLYQPDPMLVYRGMSRYRYNDEGEQKQDGVEDLLTVGSQRLYDGTPMWDFCGNTEDYMYPERLHGIPWMSDPTIFAKDAYGVFDASKLRLKDRGLWQWEFIDPEHKLEAVVAVVTW